ncbi:MAG: heme-binding protein [Rickettsiales bacterium]|nr:heme-binding protein [Rickettsiales bacterium]
MKTTKDGYYKGYETPSYKILKSSENIEIRQYKSVLVAEVESEGTREEAAKKGFLILAKYIFGKNVSKEKVAMTSPVQQKESLQNNSEKIAMTSPVSQIKKDSKKWLIQFSMPSKYNIESLPRPKDERIKFKIQKPKKVVAIKFAGSWLDKKFNEEKAKLEKFIAENKLKTKATPTIAYYDDPFTFPWNRRNEIIFEIK